jgi:hypothetical protein
MELASRIAQRKECELRAFIVLAESPSAGLPGGDAPDGSSRALAQILTDATRAVGQRLHPEMLPVLDSAHIAQESKNSLVIIATSLADNLEYEPDGLGDGRAIILVQGSETAIAENVSADFGQSEVQRKVV